MTERRQQLIDAGLRVFAEHGFRGATIDQILDVATVDGASLPVRVVGIAERTLPGQGGEAILVGWDDAIGRLGVAGADAFAVRFAADAPASARSDLAATADTRLHVILTRDGSATELRRAGLPYTQLSRLPS